MLSFKGPLGANSVSSSLINSSGTSTRMANIMSNMEVKFMNVVCHQNFLRTGDKFFDLNSATFCHLDDVDNIARLFTNTGTIVAGRECIDRPEDGVYSCKQVIIWGSIPVGP